MKIIKLFIAITAVYMLPMVAMQTQKYIDIKNEAQRKSIKNLKMYIGILRNQIGIEENAEQEKNALKTKLVLYEQELIERYKRQSEFIKSDDRNLA